MNIGEKLNMTMLCDFYELTMGNGYFENGFKDKITYFDVFFRRVPDKGGFAIAAGLEQLISVGGTCSARNFWSIWRTSGSPATSTPCRREPRCSPRSRW